MYSYEVKTLPSPPTRSDLDYYGDRGWRLVQILPTEQGDYLIYLEHQDT